MKHILFLIAMMFAAIPAVDGYEIRMPQQPTPMEQLAGDEIRRCLAQCAGEITVEGTPAVIHIGESDFARAEGQTRDKFTPEEWLVVNFDHNIVIQGGEQGVLWAAYHFLEDDIGVLWPAPSIELIPKWRDKIEIPELDAGGTPAKNRFLFRPADESERLYLRRNRAIETPDGASPADGVPETPDSYLDQYDLACFLRLKYLEDPARQDLEAWRQRFMTEYFGAAAPWMERYDRLILGGDESESARKHPLGDELGPRYLDVATVIEAQNLFDQAMQAVSYQPDYVSRLALARLPLDILTGYLMPRGYWNDWIASERNRGAIRPEALPLQPEEARKRCLAVWNQLATQGRKELAERRFRQFERGKTLPDRIPAPYLFEGRAFRDITPENFSPDALEHVVSDPTTDTGYVYPLPLAAGAEPPYVFSVVDPDTKAELAHAEIAATLLPADGDYKWYCLSDGFQPPARAVVEWQGTPFRAGLGNLAVLADGRPVALWIRFKIRDGAPETALIERVVAVRHRK